MKIAALFLLILAPLLATSPAYACSTRGLGKQSCHGCRLDAIRKDQSWMNYYKAVVSNLGAGSILSCYRTRACQRELQRTCRRGQASMRVSNHETRIAMDINASHAGTATKLAKQHIRGRFALMTNQCKHRGFHITNGPERCGQQMQGSGRTSAAVESYKAEKKKEGTGKTQDGTYRYQGVPIQCRPGMKGGWYRRNNGDWVKMMWECPL